jgi:hypothetical protein
MEFAVSMLVVPVSLTTLIALGWRCYRERRLLQALPLLATQLNSAFIWASAAAYQVGYFNILINGTQIQRGDVFSLRDIMIDSFLLNLIYLEPLNLFLYTWRFLSELEQSVSKPAAKTFLKWFARISILLIPPAFISIVTAYIVENSRYDYYLFHLKLEEVNYYENI